MPGPTVEVAALAQVAAIRSVQISIHNNNKDQATVAFKKLAKLTSSTQRLLSASLTKRGLLDGPGLE